MSVNKAIILGRLGQDPTLETTQAGQDYCKFSVATNERWKDKNGEKQEKVTWHNIVAWGAVASVISQYFKKGSEIYLEGTIDNQKYEKDGVTKYSTQIKLSNFSFVGGPASTTDAPAESGSDDGDLPF